MLFAFLHSLQLMISLKDKGTSTGIIIKKYIQVDSRSRIITAYLSMQYFAKFKQ